MQFSDICGIFGAKTSDIFSHDKSLIIGYSQILNLGYGRGLYINTNGQLVEMAGGFGSTENRETRRAEWKAMCKRRLSDADRSRVNRKEDLLADIRACVTANTTEETAAALSATEHKWRIYSDGGV